MGQPCAPSSCIAVKRCRLGSWNPHHAASTVLLPAMTHQFLLSRTGCSSLPPCLAPPSISLVSSSHSTALAWLQPGHFPHWPGDQDSYSTSCFTRPCCHLRLRLHLKPDNLWGLREEKFCTSAGHRKRQWHQPPVFQTAMYKSTSTSLSHLPAPYNNFTHNLRMSVFWVQFCSSVTPLDLAPKYQ